MAFWLKPLKNKQIFVLIDTHSGRLILVKKNIIIKLLSLLEHLPEPITIPSAVHGLILLIFTIYLLGQGLLSSLPIWRNWGTEKKHAHSPIDRNGGDGIETQVVCDSKHPPVYPPCQPSWLYLQLMCFLVFYQSFFCWWWYVNKINMRFSSLTLNCHLNLAVYTRVIPSELVIISCFIESFMETRGTR